MATPAVVPVLNSFWTASRGSEVIHCELVLAAVGKPILRCGYGPQAVIRSQFISSDAAAATVAEVWKAALELQGFHIE
jgi:hypothetical protein